MADVLWLFGDHEDRLAYVRKKFDAGKEFSREEVGFLLDHIDGKHKAPAHRLKDKPEKRHAVINALVCLLNGGTPQKQAIIDVAKKYRQTTRTIEKRWAEWRRESEKLSRQMKRMSLGPDYAHFLALAGRLYRYQALREKAFLREDKAEVARRK
jgi:hypothetical protein